MDRESLAGLLRQAVIDGWREYHREHSSETPYALALIGEASGNYLGYAIATEEGLQRVAADYDRRGYRYQGWEWEEFDNREKLAVWLRWGNPDDGWHQRNFAETFQVQPRLGEAVASGALGDEAADLEEFCTEVLASLQSASTWREQLGERSVALGFTYGSDPRDFLRTATRANPYPVVLRLWAEHARAEALARRIFPPN